MDTEKSSKLFYHLALGTIAISVLTVTVLFSAAFAVFNASNGVRLDIAGRSDSFKVYGNTIISPGSDPFQ